MSVCSNTDTNPSISNIGREFSLGKISIVLLVDILLKKLVQRLKTNAEKRAALSHYIYAFANECHENDISHTNTRWTSIRFKELIAIYGCCGDSRGLLKSNTNTAVVKSI